MADAAGLVQKNQANLSQGKHIHNYSTFDESLSYRFANTLRFGEYTPSFDMEGVENDDIRLNSLDRIDSLSLKAPFKGSIRKIKESFKVPFMAILPMQWDRIYAQPSNGDDVPTDANCIIQNWPNLCKTVWSNAFNIVKNQANAWSSTPAPSSAFVDTFYTALMRMLVLGEFMYSPGSLLHVSGYRYGAGAVEFAYVDSDGIGHRYDYDQWLDLVISELFSHIERIVVTYPSGSSSYSRTYNGLSQSATVYWSSFRTFLSDFRENPLGTIAVYTDYATYGDLSTFIAGFVSSGNLFYQLPQFYLPNNTVDVDDVTSLNPTTLNLSRVLAYQLCCAHFYTNSSIDFVYSAELYRQYIHSLWRTSQMNAPGSVWHLFNWNGLRLEYDYLSGHSLEQLLFYDGRAYHTNLLAWNNSISVLGGALNSQSNPDLIVFSAWVAIFGYRRSLRYGDYFVSSRPRPLAPINTDVSVNNNMVSVVDITRNIQAQRFANAVMRSRSKIEDYVKSLFGRAPAPDFHNPFFLSRETETIFGDEVQNTADAQAQNANSRTANLTSNLSAYTFTFHNDDMHPCIYLQIIGFDIKRAYSRSVDRQMLHIDRFDMFNPDFQYIGDQAVYGIELGTRYNGAIPDTFGYQSRDMEYKQRFDVCSSGFVKNLPGWILTDLDHSRQDNTFGSLNPDFIRSYQSELDQFFLSLTGFSLSSYFHFVCITMNNVSAKRSMAVDPQILA